MSVQCHFDGVGGQLSYVVNLEFEVQGAVPFALQFACFERQYFFERGTFDILGVIAEEDEVMRGICHDVGALALHLTG